MLGIYDLKTIVSISTNVRRVLSCRRPRPILIATLFAIAIGFGTFVGTASADPIGLSFSNSLSCPPSESCNPIFGGAGSPYVQVGDTSGGWGIIAVLSGPHADYDISDGTLGFSTGPAYYAFTSGGGDEVDYQDAFSAGGFFSITGSVFGLAPGSELISGTFLGMSCSGWYSRSGGADGCDATIGIAYVNPVVLQGLGLPLDTHFAGSLSGSTTWEMCCGDSGYVAVSVGSTPEPPTAMLAALGLLLTATGRLCRNYCR